MNTELRQSMDKMKFALNHKWKFSSWYLAFFAGLCQFLITFAVTLINYFVIIFQNEILDIVKDFLAIKVISELDNETLFYIEHKGRKEISNLLVTDEALQEVLEIETTTSRDAKLVDGEDHINKFKLKEDANWVIRISNKAQAKLPTALRRRVSDRSCGEVFFYGVYRMLRFFYVVVWFYFSPFLAMTLQFLLPLAQNIKPEASS